MKTTLFVTLWSLLIVWLWYFYMSSLNNPLDDLYKKQAENMKELAHHKKEAIYHYQEYKERQKINDDLWSQILKIVNTWSNMWELVFHEDR